jgi:tripartite-type tricarboxylate transporter receptor subunit TctC
LNITTLVLATWVATCACSSAVAQPDPTKSVRRAVGFAPGGGTDIVARSICAKLTERYGHRFTVDSRAGATGTIGTDIVAKAAPDGYALMMGHVNSHGIAPNLFKKLPYDAQRDFAMVA